MQPESSKDKLSKKKKGRTWVEAAKLVLEQYPQTPMSHKEVLKVIQKDRLKDVKSGTAPLACLNVMMHASSRGVDGVFYKVAGRTNVYGLKRDLPSGATLLEKDEESEARSNGVNSNPTGTHPKTVRGGKREKVMFVQLPEGWPTIPPVEEEDTVLCNGNENAKKVAGFIETANNNHIHDRKAVARNIRHSLRPKRRLNFVSLSSGRQQNGSRVPSKSSHKKGPSSVLTSLSLKPKRQTLQELLASIPGFSMKPRKRTHRKLSAAAQIEQTKEGCIDLETPDSILVNTNLKALINKNTFASLPSAYQYKLLQLLPECDRHVDGDGGLRMGSTALHNEFFSKSCQEWRTRLSKGEFTQESQQKLRHEEDREHELRITLDPWKVNHFEPVWNQKSLSEKPIGNSLTTSSPVLTSSLNSKSSVTSQLPTLPVKKSKLVTTMLRQRPVSQTRTATASGHVPVTSTSRSLSVSKLQTQTANQDTECMSAVSTQVLTNKTEPSLVKSVNEAVVTVTGIVTTSSTNITTDVKPSYMTALRTMAVTNSVPVSSVSAVTATTSISSAVTRPLSKPASRIGASTILQQLKRPVSVNNDLSSVMPLKRHKPSPSPWVRTGLTSTEAAVTVTDCVQPKTPTKTVRHPTTNSSSQKASILKRSPLQPGRTHTLAQIKAQPAEARQIGIMGIVCAGVAGQGARPQAQGQTPHTLAQMKAQTQSKAKLHSYSIAQQLSSRAMVTKVMAPSPVTKSVNMLTTTPPPRPFTPKASVSKSSTPVMAAPPPADTASPSSDKVNLERSLAICQQAVEKSKTAVSFMERSNENRSDTLKKQLGVTSPSSCIKRTATTTSPTQTVRVKLAESPQLVSNSPGRMAAASIVNASQTLKMLVSQPHLFTPQPQPPQMLALVNQDASAVASNTITTSQSGAIPTTATVLARTLATVPLQATSVNQTSANQTQVFMGPKTTVPVFNCTNGQTKTTSPRVVAPQDLVAAAGKGKKQIVFHTSGKDSNHLIKIRTAGGVVQGHELPSTSSASSVSTKNKIVIITRPAGVDGGALDKERTAVLKLAPDTSLQINGREYKGNDHVKLRFLPRPKDGSQSHSGGFVIKNGTTGTFVANTIGVQKPSILAAANSVLVSELNKSRAVQTRPAQICQSHTGGSVTNSVAELPPPGVVNGSAPHHVMAPLLPTGLSNSVTSIPKGNHIVNTENSQVAGNCAYSLKASSTCTKCGAFRHSDCVGPSKLCVTCLITT